jgi:hypothetical protein
VFVLRFWFYSFCFHLCHFYLVTWRLSHGVEPVNLSFIFIFYSSKTKILYKKSLKLQKLDVAMIYLIFLPLKVFVLLLSLKLKMLPWFTSYFFLWKFLFCSCLWRLRCYHDLPHISSFESFLFCSFKTRLRRLIFSLFSDINLHCVFLLKP